MPPCKEMRDILIGNSQLDCDSSVKDGAFKWPAGAHSGTLTALCQGNDPQSQHPIAQAITNIR